ncbi:MAG TPA: hypothetical protein VFS66_05155 [Acidimicrobiia bacterium]|nr:hypothetical protein [Acidimicrobiia bacterium]
MAYVEVRGSARQAIWLVVVGGLLTAVLFVGAIGDVWRLDGDALTDALTSMIPGMAFIGLGTLILWRSDAYRIGWLLGAMGLSVMLAGVAGGLGDMGHIVGHAIGGAFWLSWIMAIGLLIAWFPTGQVVSSRWRWLQWAILGAIGVTFFLYTFAEELCMDSVETVGCLEWVANPIGIAGLPNPEFGSISGPLFAVAGILFVLAVVSLILRVVRARGPERQQLKWFLLAGALVVAGFLLETVLEGLGYVPVPTWVDVTVTIGLLSLPVSVILAILRYRLYDIDRIISRTVTYAVVAALLVGVVALVATLVGTRFDDPLLVAGTTLGVAAVFNPLRRRVQRVVDRRFNRSRYDAERVMDEFARSLRDEVDGGAVLEGWRGVVSETMHPSVVGVWVRKE